MSDMQLVRMLQGSGPYNAGEVRGLFADEAEELRCRNGCEFVSRSSKGEVTVTRACKSVETAKNVAEVRRIRMEKGAEDALFTDEDVAELVASNKDMESKLKRALSEVGPLKKAKTELGEELKRAHEDNKVASKSISKLSKDNEKLEAEVASLSAQLSEALTAPAAPDKE